MNEEEQPMTEKEQEKESTKKAGALAGRAALDYFTGGKYEQLRNKPIIGNAAQKVEDKIGAKLARKDRTGMLGKTAKKLDDAGVLDTAKKAGDTYGAASGGKNLENGKKDLPKDSLDSDNKSSMDGNKTSQLNAKSSSMDTNNKSDENNNLNSIGKKLTDKFKEHKLKYSLIIAGGFLGFIFFLFLILGIATIGGTVIEYFRQVGDAIVGFFTKSEQERIEEYYERLQTTQQDIYTNEKAGTNENGEPNHICIDVNLITATLTVNVDSSDYAEQKDIGEDKVYPEEIQLDPGEEYEIDPDDPTDSDTDEAKKYKKMKKEVEQLARMQIKHMKYGYDKEMYNETGSYCRPHPDEEDYDPKWGELEEVEPVNEDNISKFEFTGLFSRTRKWYLKNGLISESAEDVAKHDANAFQKFFRKKAKEEENNEYAIYRPGKEKICNKYKPGTEDTNDDANCIEFKYVCNPNWDGVGVLSIGDLNTMRDSVYYWNLVNSFIPNYYDDYLKELEGEERQKSIERIAEDIYLLYSDLGTGQNCSNYNQPYICRDDEGNEYYSTVYDNSGNTTGSVSGARKDFLDKISAIAINEMTRVGINASVTMAQAAIESSNGNSGLSKKYSNYYGMTAGSCASGLGNPAAHKGEIYAAGAGENKCTGNNFWNGSVVAMCNKAGVDCQWYRIYNSFENSTKDHSRLLTDPNGRYAECNTYKSSLDQITCIKQHGYATSETYIESVMSVINTYDLTQYDIGNFSGSIAPVEGNQYTNILCTDQGTVIGDWANWKQANSPWSSLKIGTKTIGQVGCLLTSVAIQIARSGVPTTLGSNFDPGTFMQAHKANGGFNGNSFNWDVTKIAPSFKHKGRVTYKNVSQLASYVNQGYYVILNVHHPGEHHVAVNYADVNNNKIYMYDPGNFGNEVFSASWGGKLTIDSFNLYKVE